MCSFEFLHTIFTISLSILKFRSYRVLFNVLGAFAYRLSVQFLLKPHDTDNGIIGQSQQILYARHSIQERCL